MMVRVASYNVHGCVGADGQRDVDRITRVLRSLDADVIALQEVNFREDDAEAPPAELISRLPEYHAVGAPVSRHGKPYGNALLTRFPVVSTTRLCLAFPGREPRSALEALLDTGADSSPLRVIATHLGLRPAERRFQVRRILEHAAGDERSITVLLGDFNEWFLIGRPLRWLHARFGRGPTVRTFPARFPLFALDRIWVHPRGALRQFDAHVSAETRVASDHLPVVASLELG